MATPAALVILGGQQGAAQPPPVAPTPSPTPAPAQARPPVPRTDAGTEAPPPPPPHYPTEIMFWVTIVIVTALLIWGLQKVAHLLGTTTPGSLGAQKLRKADGLMVAHLNLGAQALTDEDEKGSFSRIAGVLGAVIISAMLLGVGYWMLMKLFYRPDDLKQLEQTKDYFLAALAIFAPYAVAKVTSIFKPSKP